MKIRLKNAIVDSCTVESHGKKAFRRDVERDEDRERGGGMKKGRGDNRGYRLLNIYQRLQQGETLTKRELADRYQVSEKTVQRDIDELRDYLAGEQSYLEIAYAKAAGGYQIARESAEGLHPDEVFAVCKILLESRPFPKDVMERLLKKLLSQVSKEKRDGVERLIAQEAHYYTAPRHGKNVIPLLWTLAACIREQRITEFIYRRLDGTQHKRTVCPAAILFSEFYFYLLGFCEGHEADGPTVFRVDRMDKIRPRKERFHRPYRDKFPEGEFRKRIQFMYAGKLRRITFTYRGPSIEAIQDRLPTLKILKEERGVYTLMAESYGKGIEMWLKTQGENVTVLDIQ